jgi:secreted Zn-dependent insulinase-like peptidase
MTANKAPASERRDSSQREQARPAELVTEDLEVPSLDDRVYRVIRLPNKLEALLVHDANADKSAASMDVNVGNFSDEDDMPGMAHAVEHVRHGDDVVGCLWVQPC